MPSSILILSGIGHDISPRPRKERFPLSLVGVVC